MAVLTLYGTTTANGTITTADKLVNTTGGTETTKKTTFSGGSGFYGEVTSQGKTVAAITAIPAPTGNGWTYGPGGGTFALGNWSASIALNNAGGGGAADVTVRFYRYSSGTYTSIGSIVSSSPGITTSRTVVTFSATSLSAITFGSSDLLYVDLWWHDPSGLGGEDPSVYVSSNATSGVASDVQITTSSFTISSVNKALGVRTRLATQVNKSLGFRFRERVSKSVSLGFRFVERTSKTVSIGVRFVERTQGVKSIGFRVRERTQGVKSLGFRFVYQPLATVKSLGFRFRERVSKTTSLGFRLRESLQGFKSLGFRFLERTQITKILGFRFVERVTATKSLGFRFREATQRTISTPFRLIMRRYGLVVGFRFLLHSLKTLSTPFRLRLSTLKRPSVAFRLILAGPHLTSGGFTLFANGTGTASYDHFRATQYPDPAMSLAPITPRVGATGASWNALVPTNTTLGMDISYDGVNWTDVTAQNGGSLPAIFSQPLPVIDIFGINSSANYTSTNRTGGAVATWTYDTANSRLLATGGTNGLFLYNAISRADIDFFADLDQSDAGGLAWRFVDANNYYWLDLNDSLASSGTPNTVTLYKVAANVQTQLGTAAIAYPVGTNTYTFVRGSYHRFRVTMLGGVITLYADGVQLLTYTDGSPLAAGKMGLYNNGGTIGSRYYGLWMIQIGDYVTGTPSGDTVTGQFVYTRARLATTDPTATPQIEDMTTYAFTPAINAGTTIPAVTYNSSFVNKNFDDLAKQSNFSWYFDANKTFSFGGVNAVAAPWILQSSPAGLLAVNDLEVDTDLELDVENDLYRNRQTILGALAVGTFSESKVGDGKTQSFTLGYPLASAPTILLNNIAQTVGLKGTSGSAFYYAVNDPIVVQDASKTVLQSTDTLSFPLYSGYYATSVTVDSVSEQTARALIEGGTGIVEDVADYTGKNLTLAAATTLAHQLIARYANAGRTLVFKTSRSGLAVGQMLTIFLPEKGIFNGQFLIISVEITLQKGVGDTQVWWYKTTVSELPRKASLAKLIASGLDFTQGMSSSIVA